MPKAKPDQVIVQRIELQETERATLEAALAGNFVNGLAMAGGNLLKGVGSALAPFQGALTALAALWIADRTIDEIADVIQETTTNVKLFFNSREQADGTYADHVAWINVNYANSGFDNLPTTADMSKLSEAQRVAWIDHVNTMKNTWGPFDYFMLLRMTAKAVSNAQEKGSMPSEQFTKEVELEGWRAWQTAFNARRN